MSQNVPKGVYVYQPHPVSRKDGRLWSISGLPDGMAQDEAKAAADALNRIFSGAVLVRAPIPAEPREEICNFRKPQRQHSCPELDLAEVHWCGACLKAKYFETRSPDGDGHAAKEWLYRERADAATGRNADAAINLAGSIPAVSPPLSEQTQNPLKGVMLSESDHADSDVAGTDSATAGDQHPATNTERAEASPPLDVPRELETPIERLIDMIRRVEWVRQSAGNKYACPICHGISERDYGPGQSKSSEAYTQHLTDANTLHALKELMALYSDLAIDAGIIVAAMTLEDFRDFRLGLKSERKGRFAGEAWAKRFNAVLMPMPMFKIAEVSLTFGVPFHVAWVRLKHVRPELFIPPSLGVLDSDQ